MCVCVCICWQGNVGDSKKNSIMHKPEKPRSNSTMVMSFGNVKVNNKLKEL